MRRVVIIALDLLTPGAQSKRLDILGPSVWGLGWVFGIMRKVSHNAHTITIVDKRGD